MNGQASYYNVYPEQVFHLTENLFTKREKEVLALMAKGMNSEEIAQSLYRSIHTVNAHRKNILRKSGCISVNDLLIKSVREGWV